MLTCAILEIRKYEIKSAEMTPLRVDRQKVTKVPDVKSCVYTSFLWFLELTLHEILQRSRGYSLRNFVCSLQY